MTEPKRAPSTSLTNPFAQPADLGFCEVLLVRHGEQQYRDNIPIGEGMDAPLSDLGRQQASAVGQRLAELQIDAVYASPLQRAFDTGAAIAGHHGLTPTVVEDVKEVDLWRDLPQDGGLRDVLDTEELRAIFKRVQSEATWDAYPYGEGSKAFRARVLRGIDGIVADNHGKRVVVACHGGVIGTVISMLLESPKDYTVSVHHTSITTIRGADTRRRILSVNDYSHVLAFQQEINPMNLH